MLKVCDDRMNCRSADLEDSSDVQKIRFQEPIMNASKLTFEISKVISGQKYKDVLLSELRLLDVSGRIVEPVVAQPQVSMDWQHSRVLDRAWSSFLYDAIPLSDWYHRKCNNQRFRLRSDGTFSYLTGFERDEGAIDPKAQLMEGNWEVKGPNVRLFGKKTYPFAAGEKPAQLFQSQLTIRDFSEMSEADQDAALFDLWKRRGGPADRTQKRLWYTGLKRKLPKEPDDWASDVLGYDIMKIQYLREIRKLNPIYVTLDSAAELLVPQDEVRECETKDKSD
jgi:hypothetical protein